MPFKFVFIPVRDDGSAEAELNSFLQSHRVLAVDRRWVEQGPDSYWSFCIDYLASRPESTSGGRGTRLRGKDYKEVLSPEDFDVFARLRDLRKEVAQGEGVPVYTVFTNEQLAQMVRSKTRTKADLERIAGVGDARIEKYGQQFLTLLETEWNRTDEAGGKPV